jgi:hypothetical protein
MGKRKYRPTILNLGTKWRGVVNFTSRLLYSRDNNPWHPLARRLNGSQSQTGPFGGKKNLVALSVLET